MKTKVRYLTSVLLIVLSLAAVHATLQAQDSTEPAATEDPCIAIIEAAMQPVDDTAQVSTADSALYSCFEAMTSTETDMVTPEVSMATVEFVAPAATDAVSAATEEAETADVYIPITVDHANEFADAGRVWVTWHDPSTGDLKVALGAQNVRISYYNMGLDVTIPGDVVNVGIRIETIPDRSSSDWQSNSTCTFALDKPTRGFSIFVDNNNICTSTIDDTWSP